MTPRDRPGVHVVAPWASPHVLPWCEALAVRDDVAVTVAVAAPLPARRARLGWQELPGRSAHLQPWRSRADRVRHARALDEADVVVLPGPFISKAMPLVFWRRLARRAPLLFWSERFLDKRPLSRLDVLARRLLVRTIDRPEVHLLAMPGAERDYAALGATAWPAWRFGYSVEPCAAPVPAARADGEPLRVAFVGELLPIKRVDLLVEAVADPRLRGVRVEIVGDGPERAALESRARLLGVADRVTFAGARPPAEAHALMARAHALVLPSRFDGWGATVPEALERGVPVIASDAVGASVMLDGTGAGATFPSGDGPALAAALAAWERDETERRAAAARAQDAVAPWRPAALAARLAALCRGVAGAGPLPAFASGPCAPIAPGPDATPWHDAAART